MSGFIKDELSKKITHLAEKMPSASSTLYDKAKEMEQGVNFFDVSEESANLVANG